MCFRFDVVCNILLVPKTFNIKIMKLIIDNKEIDFNEVYAYIPKLFSELRSDTKWNLYQVKVFTYLLSKLYKHKHKVDKKEFTNQQVESINLDHVPIEYVL
jgi:hypothetical protein